MDLILYLCTISYSALQYQLACKYRRWQKRVLCPSVKKPILNMSCSFCCLLAKEEQWLMFTHWTQIWWFLFSTRKRWLFSKWLLLKNWFTVHDRKQLNQFHHGWTEIQIVKPHKWLITKVHVSTASYDFHFKTFFL
jgi:hypothetical protein